MQCLHLHPDPDFNTFNWLGDRDGKDAVPGDGVRERRRGLRLPRPPWQDEGEGGQGQVPPDRLRRPVLPSEEDHSQVKRQQ